MIKKKFVYLFFHLNLFFSSLPENKRKEVIQKCYWPLLDLIENSNYNIGIEITGWTLNELNNLDKNWIKCFKKLLKLNKTYLIGSSYSQTIFPLVPYEVNDFNIKYGNKIYKKILNQIPKIAYVSEQCFSKSVVDLYKNNNYETLIFDWDCIKNEKKIKSKFKYYPQKIKGNKYTINVIWNSSNNFQNFQKTIHSKLNFDEYFENFENTNSFKEGIVNIYGSDAEIFDFRLKRFENEAKILNKNLYEWIKISELLNLLSKKFTFINLNALNKVKFRSNNANQLLDITSLKNMLPTKKQRKYNPLRWSIGGYDNYTINTLCWQIYLSSKKNQNTLKKLIYFWSSDFRTHIEKKRFNNFFNLLKKNTSNLPKSIYFEDVLKYKIKKNDSNKNFLYIKQSDQFIDYSDNNIYFRFDKIRGLALSSLGFIENKKFIPLIRKFNQGYFNKDRLNVDFYNGHTVIENPRNKYSDLDNKGQINIEQIDNFLIFTNKFYIDDIVLINKKWFFDTENNCMYLYNKIELFSEDFLSIRSNYLNINHNVFDSKNLQIKTKNGGHDYEKFYINQKENFFHDDPLSSKFTAQNCFGNTDGNIFFSDNKYEINIKIYHQIGSCAPMMCFQNDFNKSYFLRFLVSLKENNDVKSKLFNKNYESLMSIKMNRKND